jgi:hypothetical protein
MGTEELIDRASNRISDHIWDDQVILDSVMTVATRFVGRPIDNDSDDDPEFYAVLSLVMLQVLNKVSQRQVNLTG